MSDAQPRTVAYESDMAELWLSEAVWKDVLRSARFAFAERGIPVQNYQRRSRWGSYRHRPKHRESE